MLSLELCVELAVENEGREIATVQRSLMKAQWREEKRARRHSHGRPWVKFHKTVADVSDLHRGIRILVVHADSQALGFFRAKPSTKSQSSASCVLRTRAPGKQNN